MPLETTEAVEAPAQTQLADAAGEDDQEQPPRILLADDHPTNRKVVELMLVDSDAQLTMVENGQEAVDAFTMSAFDVILMDMQMPVMDGLAAIQHIRRMEQEQGRMRTPIVMLTANALPEHVASALAAGADMHLSKPFTASTLFDALNTAVALREDAVLAA